MGFAKNHTNVLTEIRQAGRLELHNNVIVYTDTHSLKQIPFNSTFFPLGETHEFY